MVGQFCDPQRANEEKTYDVTAKNPDAKHPPDGDAVGDVGCAPEPRSRAMSATVTVWNILRTGGACVCENMGARGELQAQLLRYRSNDPTMHSPDQPTNQPTIGA
jgi:hypothetical protein